MHNLNFEPFTSFLLLFQVNGEYLAWDKAKVKESKQTKGNKPIAHSCPESSASWLKIAYRYLAALEQEINKLYKYEEVREHYVLA